MLLRNYNKGEGLTQLGVAFNQFIQELELVDIPMIGRRFTWYNSQGNVRSRLDRMLVSLDWLDLQPDSKQFGMDRTVSDHCALVLKYDSLNWGPKPFRSLDVWESYPGFLERVKELWSSYKVNGNDIWVLK